MFSFPEYTYLLKKALLKAGLPIVLTFGLLLIVQTNVRAQQPASSASKAAASIKFIKGSGTDLFGTQTRFIENIGQYGETMAGYSQMGKIKFGFEGLGMPVLFTPKGLIHLQRKIEGPSEEEREREERNERKGEKKGDDLKERKAIDRTITMEWLNANPNPQIVTEDRTPEYHTYGLLQERAKAYGKIIYKELYPGIDLVYSFTSNKKAGFEYSLLVKPGADLSKVKMKYGGDIKDIGLKNGRLIIKSDIDGIEETIPVSFYGNNINLKNTAQKIKSVFVIKDNEISFSFPEGYDNTKAIVIDPFVSSTLPLALPGTFAGKAIDVDYDYAGNVYVAGGGVTNQSQTASHSHAKYNSAGGLEWTFNGVLTIPTWRALYYYGGWVVDKNSGALYIGQGFSNPGFQVIRVSTTGLYDNYITTSNANFQEAWRMYWYCNSGNPQIICAGGGLTSNTNIAICAPPSTTLVASANLTGAPEIAQDMSDLVIDPLTNSLYTIYVSPLNATIHNKIFKNNAPYSFATNVWSAFSGYPVLGEILNRPYLGGSYADNSSNILAINANYLFYWDGLNLKAIDKNTGATAGAPLTLTGNSVLNQGGIVADACNNVFIGNTNGTIKVYKFNGATFDNAGGANDIKIPGFNSNVYDLALDESKKLLYASGDGFVASFDVSPLCPTTNYKVTVVPDCATAGATATISPATPPNSTVTYTLFNGATQIATISAIGNNPATFTGLLPNITYTVVATVNLACSGTQASTTFVLPGPTINFTSINSSCGLSIGEIHATGSVSPGPYTYSLNGGAFQGTGDFTGLAAGVYTLVVKGAGGCTNKTVITILNTNGPALLLTPTNADCGSNNGTVTANVTGGTLPYTYSINGTTFQSGNFFTGLLAGSYVLTVKDASGCTNAAVFNITSSPKPLLNAIPAAATCGNSNGSITAFGSGGTGALQYSINGNIFQLSNSFTNLSPGPYTVTVKDVNGCTNTITVTIANSPAPTVTSTATPAACNNINGTITATGSGGIGPYQYSINGGPFQSSNIFTGLATGVYTIRVQDDASGCINSTIVSVGSVGGPSVTASSSASACGVNDGVITAVASGGGGGYTYSLDGVIYQPGASFNGRGAGNYVVYVKDANGCIGTTRVTVVNTSGLSLNVSSTVSSCGANNGIITATATGGSGTLLYSKDGITYLPVPGNVFTGLGAGSYTIYVKDGVNCIVTRTVNLANPSSLGLTASVVVQATCGTSSGAILATASGGVAPFTYSIGGPFQTLNGFVVAAGNYVVTVKDASGCIATQSVTVTNTAGTGAITDVTFNIVNELACTGKTGGRIKNLKGVGPGGGGTKYEFSLDGGLFQTGNQFSAPRVPVGTHFISARVLNTTCLVTKIAIVSKGVPATATAAVTPAACGTTNGKIDLTGVGANVPYHASIDGGATWITFDPTTSFLNLAPGTYPIIIADDADFTTGPPDIPGACLTTILVVVPSIGGPTISSTQVINGTCVSINSGSITVTGTSNMPLTYSIDGGGYSSNNVFTNLAPGPHVVSVQDGTGCKTGITVILADPAPPAVTAVVQSISCGLNNGTITATGTGGSAPLEYSIDGTVYVTNNVFTGLKPGPYNLYVRDANKCFSFIPVTIANTLPPKVTAFTIAATCGGTDGVIVAEGSLGEAPYTFSKDGITYQSSSTFDNLAAGFYTIYIKDARGCITSTGVPLDNTSGLSITNVVTASANCDKPTGTITVTAAGGSGALQYSITGRGLQPSGSFLAVLPGDYTVTVKDANGCLATKKVTVGNTLGPQVLTAKVTDAACGLSTGTITATGSGGTGTLQYSIDGGALQASNVFNNVAAGPHTLMVQDVNGCQKNLTPVTILNLSGPGLTLNPSGTSCGGLSDGSITAVATGGTLALQYNLDGGAFQASNIFIGVAFGPHAITVKDARGCTTPGNTTVPVVGSPVTPTFAAIGPLCQNSTAPALLPTSTNGIAGTWNPTTISTATVGTTNYTFTPNGGQCATPLPLPVTISANITPTFAPIGPLCQNATAPTLPLTSTNGIAGTWNPATISTATVGTTNYTFTPNGGQCATPLPLPITINAAPTATISYAGPFCTSNTTAQAVALTGTAGGTYTAIPAGLTINATTGAIIPSTSTPGTYAVTYTIAASGGCPVFASLPASVTITAAPTATINYTGPFCANNTTAQAVAFTGTAGGTYTAPAGLTINPTTGAIIPSTSTPGTYAVTYTIAATGGCPVFASLPASVTINPILSPTINCGVSTTSSVTFDWVAVTGATGYTISYQINANPVVTIGAIGNVLTYQVTGLAGGDNVKITVTPTGGAGTCFISNNTTCTATACTPPTVTVGGPNSVCQSATPAAIVLSGASVGGGATTGAWSITSGGGTLSSTAQTGSPSTVTYTPAANYTGPVTLTLTTNAPGTCPGVSAVRTIAITPKPAATPIYHN
jgi:SprB repeat